MVNSFARCLQLEIEIMKLKDELKAEKNKSAAKIQQLKGQLQHVKFNEDHLNVRSRMILIKLNKIDLNAPVLIYVSK